MGQIIFDFTFWFGIILIIVGFVLFKGVNNSIKKQEDKLEDPKNNFEKLMQEWIQKYGSIIGEKNIRIHSNVQMVRIIPIFIIAIGIIAIFVAIIK